MSSLKVRIFNDPIHGHFELSNLSMKIIDTPQFQRLRDISQLGSVYYVFSGASSKRFEHSIGVAHLSRTFVNEIFQKQPELNITAADMLCLEIAGLCHDLGHGPFSHLFDSKILPKVIPDLHKYHFEHEHASIGILDLLIKDNNLLPEFKKHGLDEDDIHFIKELILGCPEDMPAGMEWRGRGKKTFLYDIVANKRNGIDVDKFDYFARDCHVLGLTKSFDSLRLMRFARVHKVQRKVSTITPTPSISQDLSAIAASEISLSSIVEEEGSLEICYHVKEAWNIFELFHTRYTLHKRAYQHRVAGAIDHMLVEALVLANPYFTIPGAEGKPKKMSDCPFDYEAYWRLTEYVVRAIENSTDQNLMPARSMIKRLRKRQLLPCVAEILLSPSSLRERRLNETKIHQEIYDLITSSPASTDTNDVMDIEVEHEYDDDIRENALADKQIRMQDVYVMVVNMGYGKGGKNPVTELTTFYQPVKDTDSSIYDESSPSKIIPQYTVGLIPLDSVSLLTPREFEESYVRVYCRYKHQVPEVRTAFQQWCAKMQGTYQSTTPLKRKRSSSIAGDVDVDIDVDCN